MQLKIELAQAPQKQMNFLNNTKLHSILKQSFKFGKMKPSRMVNLP